MAAPIRLMSSCVRATASTRCATTLPTPLLSSARSLRHQIRSRQQKQQKQQRYFSTPSHLMEDKKYTEDHEWIDLSSDRKTGTIGITTYAAKALGDVVYVELPTVDLQVNKGDTIGAVESVKSASDIMTPLSGRIIETNGLLEEKPGLINKGPETEQGWLARIEVQDAREMDGLMSKEEYDVHAEGEEGKE